MPVTDVAERFERRRSSIKDGKVSHTRTWLVTCDAIGDGTAAALTASASGVTIPRYGDRLFPANAFILATSIDAEPVANSSVHFEVSVEYTTVDIGSRLVTPLDRPPEITWNASESTEPYFMDCSAPTPKYVANTAGDPFDQFLERESGSLVIQITLNEATHDAALADTFSNTVNAEAITIDATTFAPGTLKLSPITATKVFETIESAGYETRYVYYRRSYNLKARRDGWKDRPLDVGQNELVSDPAQPTKPPKLMPILAATSTRVSRPYPLDGNGRKRATPTEAPAVLEFLPYTVKSWATLAIANPAIWTTP
jgi:hypothetical protein